MENASKESYFENNEIDASGDQVIPPGEDEDGFTCAGFQSLFAELAAGNGKTLARWLRSEAQRKGVSEKDMYRSLSISAADYQKLLSGPVQSRMLSAEVFARVADWLEISMVGTLAAAGFSEIDARRDQQLKGKCVDFALDKIARHPIFGKLLPVEVYLTAERVRESYVRIYQEAMGKQLIPEEADWDEILDGMMSLEIQSRAYCH